MIEGAKAVSALNIGSKYRYRRIGVSAKADERYRIGPKKSVSVDP